MRKSLLTTAALIGLATAPAFAQVGSTQSPPTPNSSSQPPQPVNSLPAGAATSSGTTPGSNLGTTTTPNRPVMAAPTMPMPAATPMVTASPATPVVTAAPVVTASPAVPVRPRPMMRRNARVMDAPADAGDTAAPPTSAYRGGATVPLSQRASNTTSANTRSEIAPRLPDPTSAGNSPRDYVEAARRSLARGQTGAAQEALERAETRLLSRSTDPSMANQPDTGGMVLRIGEARRALASNNVAGARAALDMIGREPGPQPMAGQPGMTVPAPRAY